jgi:hypothetical protein
VSVNEPSLVIALGSHHNREAFSCGEPALDTYLQRQATQDIKRPIAQVFVAMGDVRERITSYYSRSAASFQKDELPPALAKRPPHYPVPAAVLGRLAIDRAQQGRRLGETSLLDGIRRVVRASTTVAVYAIVVDAKKQGAQAF